MKIKSIAAGVTVCLGGPHGRVLRVGDEVASDVELYIKHEPGYLPGVPVEYEDARGSGGLAAVNHVPPAPKVVL